MDKALAVMEQALEECLSAPLFGLSATDLLSSADRIQTLAQRLTALQLGLVREVDGRNLAGSQGGSGTVSWLAARWRVRPGSVSRMVKLAAAMDQTAPAVATALAAGAVNVEQVQVIAPAIEQLPAEHRSAGEAFLLDQAGTFGPRELDRLTHRLLEVVAPEVAGQSAEKALSRAEQRAFHARTLTLTEIPGASTIRVSGWLGREDAAIVSTALDPLCNPRRPDPRPTEVSAADGRDERTAGQRRADALVDVCRIALASRGLPVNGGDRPQVIVTVSLDALRQRIQEHTLPGTLATARGAAGPVGAGIAELDAGNHITAEAARRIACDATIIPAVLGNAGQVLDLGRQRRLISGALRKALAIRDRGCAFPTCDRPARWTDGHHIRHWADGGATTLNNSVLLCGYHHRVIHHTDWQVHINPADGHPEFLPPPELDPHQRPRRNTYHRRL